MNREPHTDPISELKKQADVFVGLCFVAAFPVVLMTTRWGTWGRRYLDRFALMGLAWPMLFMMIHGHHPQAMSIVWYWFAMWFMLVVHKTHFLRRQRAGIRCHSRSWGESRFETSHDLRSQRQARTKASLVVLLIGILLLVGARPLALMWIFGAVAKLISEAYVFHGIEARLRQMDDMQIETAFYVEEYRRRHGHF